MWNTYIKTILLLSIFVLISGCTDRKVIQGIPSEVRGNWLGMLSDPEISLKISRDKLVVINRDYPTYLCNVDKVISYKEGWIVQEQKIAVICDKRSTDIDQRKDRRVGVVAPNDYRKTFYISKPNKDGEISVSHTKYMSKGYSGSKDTYVWNIDNFYRR